MESSDSGNGAVVSILYALPDEQFVVEVPFVSGMTAREALERSGLAEQFPHILDADSALGAFGQRISHDQIITVGARIEVLRPLQRDPREARRIMMSLGLVMGQRER